MVAGAHIVDHKLATSLVTRLLSQPFNHRTAIAARALSGIDLDLLQHKALARLEPPMGTTHAAAIEPWLNDIVPSLLALLEAPVCFPLERGCFQ